jgi:hypothetical protein
VSTPCEAKSQRQSQPGNILVFPLHRARLGIRSCVTCARYTPRVDWQFHKSKIVLTWTFPFFRWVWLPSEESYRFATCLMSGDFAAVEREFGCEDGHDWEASRG